MVYSRCSKIMVAHLYEKTGIASPMEILHMQKSLMQKTNYSDGS